jgi:uncharacterized protein (TIGR00369 family)
MTGLSMSLPPADAETPFSRELGIEVIEWGQGRAVIALDTQARLMNRRGVLHGGVIATLADMALSLAWRGAAPDGVPAGTLNLSVNFVAPAVGRLIAEGRLLQMTGGCAFCEATIADAAGALVATAQAVFRVRRAAARSDRPIAAD